jgi:hypothetical protein
MKAGWNAGSCHCGRIVMKAFVHQSIRPLPLGRHGRLSAKDDHLSRQPMSSRGTDHMSEKSPFRPCGRDLVEFFNSTG